MSLSRKAFDTLLILAQNSGQIVSKDELMRRLWPDTIVEENNLTQRISQVRKALGENKKDHDYIVTAPGQGYCFVAKVTVVSEQTSLAILDTEESDINQEAGTRVGIVSGQLAPLVTYTAPFLPRRHRKALVVFALLSGLITLPTYVWIATRTKARPPEASAGKQRSLAVLPFKSLNAQDADDHLGPGIADALITKLSNIREISVRPTRGVLKYDDSTQSPLIAGRELDVDSVLDGSIQKAGDRIRVTVQLVNVRDGKSLWARSFDEQFTSIFAIQDSISEQVAHSLMIELTDETRQFLVKHHTDSTEAYQAYLKGRYFWNKRTKEGLAKAVDYFQQAVTADPKYALAYAGLADAYALSMVYHSNVMSAEDTGQRVFEAASRAVELDDKLAEGHTSLAACFQFTMHPASAEKEFVRALALNPGYATAHQWYGEFLRSLGRFDEALAELKRAQEIDPLSPIINYSLGTSFYLARQYDQMAEQNRKALEIDPNFAPAHLGLGLALEQRGMYEEAISEFQKATDLSGESELMIASLAHAYAVAGNRSKAQRTFEELKKLSKRRSVFAGNLALFYAASGERDDAFIWLQKAQECQEEFRMLRADPRLDNLRADPKFQALLQTQAL